MKNIFLHLAILLTAFSCNNVFAQAGQKRKPDMKKVGEKAIENFIKNKSEGKTYRKEQVNLSTSGASRNINVFDYTQLPSAIRIPGQFEESQAIAMTWQYLYDANNIMTNVPASDSSPNTLGKVGCDLAAAIQQNAKVIIRVKAAQDSITVKNIMINRGTPLTNYSFYVHPIDSFWDRDSGPISFYYGAQDNIGFIDMDYYTYAAVEDDMGNVSTDFNSINQGGRVNDDLIPQVLGTKFGYPVYKTPLNDEGGNIISDGLGSFWGSNGTRRTNTQILNGELEGLPANYKIFFNYPILNQSQFNTLFTNSFKINNHIEAQVFSCDGGTGHIDIYGKLIDENNFALADYTQAVNHSDYDEWNANLTLFQNLQDSNGKPITIKLVPMPKLPNGNTQTECEGTATDNDQRNYINGVFVNKTYIMPVQSNPTNLIASDVAAITAFQQKMPGYNVVPIDAGLMFGTGGAIHCITMQIPAENPIFIRHSAITGNQPLQPYVINAVIKNNNGLASQFVYYKKSTQTTWTALPLVALGNNNFSATIPITNFSTGDEIHYFIEATNNSNKIISKPFVAREGGFNKFTISTTLGNESFDNQTNFILGVYPNPSSTGSFILPISLDNSRKVDIQIYDVLGRTVYQDVSDTDRGLHLKNIEIPNNKGIYIIKTSIDNKIVKTQKLIIN